MKKLSYESYLEKSYGSFWEVLTNTIFCRISISCKEYDLSVFGIVYISNQCFRILDGGPLCKLAVKGNDSLRWLVRFNVLSILVSPNSLSVGINWWKTSKILLIAPLNCIRQLINCKLSSDLKKYVKSVFVYGYCSLMTNPQCESRDQNNI